jgi:hypothetical protein
MSGTWTCGRCGVTASFETGALQPVHPVGWAQTEGSWCCLGCRRTEVVDGATASEGTSAAVSRRRALTEFELLRDHAATDRIIARRVRCPTAAVPPVRAALRADGRLPPAEPAPPE